MEIVTLDIIAKVVRGLLNQMITILCKQQLVVFV
jgi:hypothetical protein